MKIEFEGGVFFELHVAVKASLEDHSLGEILDVVVGPDNATHIDHHDMTDRGFSSELGVAALGVGGNTGRVVGHLDRAGVVIVHLDLDQTQLLKGNLVILQVLFCVDQSRLRWLQLVV